MNNPGELSTLELVEESINRSILFQKIEKQSVAECVELFMETCLINGKMILNDHRAETLIEVLLSYMELLLLLSIRDKMKERVKISESN